MRRWFVLVLTVAMFCVAAAMPASDAHAQGLVIGGVVVCTGAMEPTPIAGTLITKASVSCIAGYKPSAIRVYYQKANVNTPNSWVPMKTDQNKDTWEKKCFSDNPCTTWASSEKIDKTMMVRTYFNFTAISTRGGIIASPNSETRQGVYNDQGQPYPQIRSYRGSEKYVPFPAYNPQYGWVSCQERAKNPSNTLPCWRDPKFPDNVKARYSLNRWLWLPTGNPQVHHIHPLGQGGGNDPQNGVQLSFDDHTKLNNWWRSFSARWWSCPGCGGGR